MMKRYEKIGEMITTTWGFEDKRVVMYWTALENQNWKVCEKIYERFKNRG